MRKTTNILALTLMLVFSLSFAASSASAQQDPVLRAINESCAEKYGIKPGDRLGYETSQSTYDAYIGCITQKRAELAFHETEHADSSWISWLWECIGFENPGEV